MQSENTNLAALDEIPEGLTEVGRFSSRAPAEDRALVVLAMGLPYWLFEGATSFRLCVESPFALAVREQLALFDVEEKRSGSAVEIPAATPASNEGSTAALAAYAAILVGIFALSQDTKTDLIARGRLDAIAIFMRSEWWRAVTALTLHADIAHLVGNLAGGVLFGHFATRRFGAGFAWLLILVAGTLGNLATAWIFRGSGHLALGASTAIFGALGLLAGCTLSPSRKSREHGRHTTSPMRPLIAALVLLALLGAGSAHTDVVAHLAGFVAGAGVGFVSGMPRKIEHRGPGQALLALVAMTIVAFSWFAALSHAPR